MFNNKPKAAQPSAADKPKATPSPSSSNDTYTRIGEQVKIIGDINCKGDVRVDGNVEGNITTSTRVIIGTKGKVLGNINCDSAEIDGKFNGLINTKNLLSITENADIEGDVITGRLSISDPASFNVKSCKMQKENAAAAPATPKS